MMHNVGGLAFKSRVTGWPLNHHDAHHGISTMYVSFHMVGHEERGKVSRLH